MVPGTRGDLQEMAARYLPPQAVDPYVEMAEKDHGPQTKLFLEPKQWVSLDLGGGRGVVWGGFGAVSASRADSPAKRLFS